MPDPYEVTTSVHMPGAPVTTPEDEKSSREFEAALAKVETDTAVVPVEYDGIDTTSPDANYDTRSNIVRP